MLNITLGDLANQNFAKLLKKNENTKWKDVELIKSIYRARMNEERYESACDDLRKLSAVGYNENEDLPGDHFTKLKYGYDKFVQYLSSQIPKESIRLNQKVETIDWSSKSNRVAAFNHNDHSRAIYNADFVICTIPLGYLKRYHNSMFIPKLSLKKTKAIENLGFGVVDKLFLVYDKPVFKNIQGLQILWRDDIPFHLEFSNKKWNLQVCFFSF